MNWLSDSVNQLSLLGAVVIVVLTVVVVLKYVRQMKTDKATGELATDSWDGIGEFKNPLPIGWAVMFIVTMVWAVWYWFIGYPLNAYSQIGEWNQEVKSHNKHFEEKWKSADAETLKNMGEGVYLVQCAPCHGIDGSGIEGKAADLTQWGKKAGIVDVVKNGSKGLGYPLGEMPGGLVSDEAEINAVAEFIMGGMQGEGQGKTTYDTYCASCHGNDGKGMNGMSPDLTTYGKEGFVLEVLKRGKTGSIGLMPNFNDGRLTDIQKKAVSAYILSVK